MYGLAMYGEKLDCNHLADHVQADFISALGHDLPEDGIWCVLSAHVCGLLVSGPTHPLVPRPSPLLTRCHMVINWATDA